MGYGHPANGEHNFYGEFKTRKEAEDMMNRLNGEPMWVEDLYFPKGSKWGQEWDEEKVEEGDEKDFKEPWPGYFDSVNKQKFMDEKKGFREAQEDEEEFRTYVDDDETSWMRRKERIAELENELLDLQDDIMFADEVGNDEMAEEDMDEVRRIDAELETLRGMDEVEQQELDEEYETGEKSQFFTKKYRADAYNHPNRSPSYNVNRDRATDLLTSNKLDGRQKAEWSNKFLESAKSREDYLVDEHLLIEFLETFGEEPYYGA